MVSVVSGCDSGGGPGPDPADEDQSFVILYTNDEHGWIEETGEAEGAAKLTGLWKSREGYDPAGDFLILSGGDNWTGPAISTWFQGESTVDVMNAMGYGASVLGNHEFDFKVEGLRERLAQADFPYLAANIRSKASGSVPDFATPFVVRRVNGIDVGLIGLASRTTPTTTFPTYVEDYDFQSYSDALEEWVPKARAAGADVMVVLGHLCHDELLGLVSVAKAQGVDVLTGGHCNERVAEVTDDLALVIAGWQFDAYGRVEVFFDPSNQTVTRVTSELRNNTGGTADPGVEAVVATWQAAAAQELNEVIGFLDAPLAKESAALHNLVTDSWLFARPASDLVLTNSGGIRQGIEAGEITRGTIVGVLPFQNQLVELDLTGSQVVASLRSGTVIAGFTTVGGYFHADGTPMVMDSVYQVLTTDYLYAREDYPFAGYDPTPYNTGISYQQPTVSFLQHLATNPGDPLDGQLDPVARR